jgi:hypothetical protein
MSPARRLGPVPDGDLDEDIGDVPFDCVHANAEGGAISAFSRPDTSSLMTSDSVLIR